MLSTYIYISLKLDWHWTDLIAFTGMAHGRRGSTTTSDEPSHKDTVKVKVKGRVKDT